MLPLKVQINANKVAAAAAIGVNMENLPVKSRENTGKAAKNETIYVNVFRKKWQNPVSAFRKLFKKLVSAFIFHSKRLSDYAQPRFYLFKRYTVPYFLVFPTTTPL